MGTPACVVPVLQCLRTLPAVDVSAVFTPPDRPRGRGRNAEPPPVKQAALELGIPVFQPASLRGDTAQSDLASLRPDVIVVAAYGRFLPTPILELPPHGCLNLHPSLLPRHRGPSPVPAAILEGDGVTGVSLMLLDEGMDTGPVIARQEYAMTGEETAGDLTDTLFEQGSGLLASSLEAWVRGELNAEPQDAAEATVSHKLERSDGEADWSLPAEILARQRRAYAPWPGLYTDWADKTLKLVETSVLPEPGGGKDLPGTVVAANGGRGLQVATGAGMLALNRVQLEGKRPVSGEEFLRGYPEILGIRLGSNRRAISQGDR